MHPYACTVGSGVSQGRVRRGKGGDLVGEVAVRLAFSAAMTAQVPPIAGRADLTVTVAPGAGRGAPACFLPATAEIEVNGACLPVDPATANPASVADRERYPALWGATVHECAHVAHSAERIRRKPVLNEMINEYMHAAWHSKNQRPPAESYFRAGQEGERERIVADVQNPK